MNTILKRVISLLLCSVMIAGYMPANAFAEETGETVTAETTEVTAEQTEAASEETEAPSESTESLAELSEVTDGSDEEEEETEKESEKEEKEAEKESKKEEKEAEKESEKEEEEAEKESEKEEEEAEKESEKEEKEAEKEAKKEEKESEKETEPSTEPSTEAAEPSTVEIVPEETVPETTEEGVALFGLERASAVELNVPSSEDLAAELERVQKYVDYMMSQNDPETVVKTFKKHFTWDTELRENSKSYLYDWSYYNGVVFEGLEYLYEVTGESKYKDYVVEYMSSLINADGTWANCTNDGYTDKQAAGYNENHGVDTFKTASLLLDAYAMTNDSRYLTMAGTIAGHLENVAVTSDSIGGNYVHTWGDGGTPSYALWLDGLYMTLPFRAEYAEYAGDTAKLQDIVERLTWVSENMYDSDNGLFYHAANANDNSGTFWLRSIGWYAAALADVMDSVDSTQRAVLADQLTKLADGLKAHYNEGGMWLNKLTADYNSSTNPYETSGTALVSYALLKAVNNGWIDESYADMALTAFYTISIEKLNSANTTLTDICQKGAPTTSNSTFKDNEGKGVGPFIMLYAEVLEYTGVEPEQPEQPTEPSEPTEPADQEITVEGTTEDEAPVTMTVSGVSAAVTAAVLTEEDKTLLDAHAGIESYVAIDVTGTLAEGEKATFTVAIPEGWDADRVVGISVEEGVVKEIEGTHENGYFTFTVEHFSAKGVGLTAKAAETTGNSGTGNLVGGKVYTLDTDGVIDTSKTYLIVGSQWSYNGTTYSALTNDGGDATGTTVTVTNNEINVEDDSTIAWKFSGTTSGNVSNNGRYVYPNRNSLSLSEDDTSLNISSQGSGAYRIYRYSNYYYYYLNYNNGWTGARTYQESSVGSVYLYELTSSSAGEAVTFTVTPGTTSVVVGSTTSLIGTVTVGDKTVDLDECTVSWDSDASSATVSEGVVRGAEVGTANITATLSAVNGTALQENIVLTIPVTVRDKAVHAISLSSNTGKVVKNKPASTIIRDEDNNPIKVTVTYDGGDTTEINLTLEMISGNYNIAQVGEYTGLTVTYGEGSASNFTLNVTMNPGNNHPEYPNAGSVDVNKVKGDISQFQNLGVAEIQLSTSGIPIKRGVDVVLVADISNSMAWVAGKKNTSPSAGQTTKWQDLQGAAGTFIDVLLEDNEDGTTTANTVSFVTFGGYDVERNNTKNAGFDSVRTVFTSVNDATSAKNQINAFSITGTDSDGYTVTINGSSTGVGTPQGGTNYDYAFLEAASAIEQIKADYAAANNGDAYDDSGREIYVVFMTDGAPDHYNQLYYKSRSSGQFDYNALYINDLDTIDVYASEMSGYEQHVTNGYFMPSSGNISNANWINWIESDALATAEAVLGITGVNSITAIGFDLENGAFSDFTFSEEILTSVLQNLAGENSCEVMTTADSSELSAFYASLASKIKMAATNAYFVDQMGDSFELQRTSTITKFDENKQEITYALNPLPSITVSTYNIYKKSDVGTTINGVEVTQAMVGERYGDPTVMETVVFSADGKQAFSSIDGYEKVAIDTDAVDADGKATTAYTHTGTDIMNVNGVVCAEYFWYNTSTTAQTITLSDGSTYSLPAETFYWDIGTINDKEFVLSYYVYLTGSAEGKVPAGTYATNNYAILHYTNYLDNEVDKEVQSPSQAWESAAVNYGFYLVNQNGKPVVNQTTGETGSFYDAIKVTNAVLYSEILLNSIDDVTSIEVDTTAVPPGYVVYDEDAVYTITIESGGNISGWAIQKGTDKTQSTYVTDYRGAEATNVVNSDNLADRTGLDFTSTTVWFALVWEPKCIDDAVVIDYGLPVDISVLGNDMFGDYGTLDGVGGKADKPVESGYVEGGEGAFDTSLRSAYGDVMVNGSEVRYTLKTMAMNSFDEFSYEVKYTVDGDATNLQYYYGNVTVIPASIIYYEDTFTTETVTEENGTTTTITRSGITFTGKGTTWAPEGEQTANATQAEDRPGTYHLDAYDSNNVYGFDETYEAASKHSLGSAMKVNVSGTNTATAEFNFYGTGFDVISMTSGTTGTIIVTVKPVNSDGTLGDAVRKNIVDTFYGYVYDEETGWQPANDASDDNAIYQVPVMEVADLPYGHYNVVIKTAYDAIFDHTGDKNYNFYLDAIRIYDPAGVNAGETNTTVSDAYAADSEATPEFVELRNLILKAEDFNALEDGKQTEGAIFIDHSAGDYTIDDYKSYGPNNELYLAKGQSVAFDVDLTEYAGRIADIQIALKSANNKEVHIKASNGITENTRTIKTGTDLYYSIKSYLNMSGKTTMVLTNMNDDEAIVSITNIKVTFNAAQPAMDDDFAPFVVSRSTGGNALMMLRRNVEVVPETSEPEIDVPETGEPEESVPETDVPDESVPEVTDPETSEPEETEPEEMQPDKESEKIQKEIEKAMKKAVKEAEKVAKELQKAAEKAAKALSKLFGNWF